MNAYGMQSGGSGMPPVPQSIFASYSSSSAAEPRLTALNPVPTVGSAVSAVAKMFGAIDIAAARHPNSHSPAQKKSRKRKCSGRAK